MPFYYRECNLGFTVVWKIEKISYFLRSKNLNFTSPIFNVGLEDSDWYLTLSNFKRNDNTTEINCYLSRSSNGPDRITVCYELAFLNEDGSPKVLEKEEYHVIKKNYGAFTITTTVTEANALDSSDNLIVRCRIWKDARDTYNLMQCFIHTYVPVEERSLILSVSNFNSLGLNEKRTFIARSVNQQSSTFRIEIFLAGESLNDSKVAIKITNSSVKQNLTMLKISLFDSEGRLVTFVHDKQWCEFANTQEIVFSDFISRSQLMEDRSRYLPNDMLYLHFKFIICVGDRLDKIEEIHYGMPTQPDATSTVKHTSTQVNMQDEASEDENKFSDPGKNIISFSNSLEGDLRSLYKEGTFCDFNLSVGDVTFPVHKSILSARSPIFRTMFTTEMLEKTNNSVSIPDLDAKTVNNMLLYMYTDVIDELQWQSALKLYFAADKYQLLSLKQMCSTFLQTNLSSINVYEILILSDLHHDDNLKKAVQDFIFSQDVTIIDSKEWKIFEEDHSRLAAETMRQIYLRRLKN